MTIEIPPEREGYDNAALTSYPFGKGYGRTSIDRGGVDELIVPTSKWNRVLQYNKGNCQKPSERRPRKTTTEGITLF